MPNKPTRDQLARFLPTLQLIKAFESLFDLTDDDGAGVAALQQAILTLASRVTGTEADISSSEVNDAVESAGRLALAASLAELAKAVDGLAMMPPDIPVSRVDAATIAWNVRAVSAAATAAVGDWMEVDASGGAVTITLPSAPASKGRVVAVAKIDASGNSVTLSGDINGAASATISVQYTALTLVSIGTEWRLS